MMMQAIEPTIVQQLSSPTFWFVNVLLALLVNVVGAAIWKTVERTSTALRVKQRERAHQAVMQIVERIRKSDADRQWAMRQELRLRATFTNSLVITVLFLQQTTFSHLIAGAADEAWRWLALVGLIATMVSAIVSARIYTLAKRFDNAIELERMLS
jgi:cellobiose-specific phosphotransferase system component IIC